MRLHRLAGLALAVTVAVFAWRCWCLVDVYRGDTLMRRGNPWWEPEPAEPLRWQYTAQVYAAGVCLLLSGIWCMQAQWPRRANGAIAP